MGVCIARSSSTVRGGSPHEGCAEQSGNLLPWTTVPTRLIWFEAAFNLTLLLSFTVFHLIIYLSLYIIRITCETRLQGSFPNPARTRVKLNQPLRRLRESKAWRMRPAT